jgi:hypothetical protein
LQTGHERQGEIEGREGGREEGRDVGRERERERESARERERREREKGKQGRKRDRDSLSAPLSAHSYQRTRRGCNFEMKASFVLAIFIAILIIIIFVRSSIVIPIFFHDLMTIDFSVSGLSCVRAGLRVVAGARTTGIFSKRMSLSELN